MPLLFIDYTKRVLKTYEEKRNNNLLSQLLMDPTTANIKQECLNVYIERVERGEKVEENTLRGFFSVPPAGKDFAYLIKKCKPDKFRPLQSLIKREIKKPTQVNVELLAWLIDFIPRPLSLAQKVLGNTNENFGSGSPTIDPKEVKPKADSEQNNLDEGKELISTSNAASTGDTLQKRIDDVSVTKREDAVNFSHKNPNKSIIGVAIGLIIVVFLGVAYIIWQQERDKQKALEIVNTGCMYWAEDHYEAMPCNEERKNRLKLPMDPERIKNFKRILREDTITERSIGKIYYIKIDGRIEYYTTGGNHPVDVTRTLKPLSPYMFEKYLFKQKNANKDSLPK
jgi:hypothetical protein